MLSPRTLSEDKVTGNATMQGMHRNVTLHVHIPYPARWKMYGVCRLQKITDSEVANCVRGLTIKQHDRLCKWTHYH